MELTRYSAYIAKHYWPQHLVKADGLGVMEVYRNAVFRERVEYEHRVAEEEEVERRREEVERGFVDEGAQMPGLGGEDVWAPQAGEEAWRPVDTREDMQGMEMDGTYENGDVWGQQGGEETWKPVDTKEDLPGMEIDGIYDEDGGVPIGDSSWEDETRWRWGESRGG